MHNPAGQKAFTVSQATAYIKGLLEHDPVLSQFIVRGELSNYKIHPSGHHYFTLKDDGAVMQAVMFRGDAGRLRFRPQSGMTVIAYGRVSVFPKSGQYQLYVTDMQPDGVGALAVAYEQLKERLRREGLFDASRKRPLPRYPQRVALITAPSGAAVRDMIRVLSARFPLAEVLVCPVKVQGAGAAAEIAAMLDTVNQYKLADVIITGRGGGSIEDLWAFNEEAVARAIFRSAIPVIAAVGHEPDVTIADFVADVRAATPSNGAELAVRDGVQVRAQLHNAQALLTRRMQSRIESQRARLNAMAEKPLMRSPYAYLNTRRMELDRLSGKLSAAGERKINGLRQRFVRLASALDALSPLTELGRGYAMATRQGKVLRSVRALSPGDRVTLRLGDGRADADIVSVTPRASQKEDA
jgi:exodeoxyribonuclease VII large subunit